MYAQTATSLLLLLVKKRDFKYTLKIRASFSRKFLTLNFQWSLLYENIYPRSRKKYRSKEFKHYEANVKVSKPTQRF